MDTFPEYTSPSPEYSDVPGSNPGSNTTFLIWWYLVFISALVMLIVLLVGCVRIIFIGQKTRDPQRNRMYGGSRSRPSLSQSSPSIYVSPSNLPPPPKYEFMAPPSYEEVVGVHPPSFSQGGGTSASTQPITQPIADAIASTSPSNQTNQDSQPTNPDNQPTSPGNQATNPDNQETNPDNQQSSSDNQLRNPVNQTEQPGTSAQVTTTVTITSETAKPETAINVSS